MSQSSDVILTLKSIKDTAYSIYGGQNTIENANLTECQTDKDVEGYHIVFAEISTMKYSLGMSNSNTTTFYSRQTDGVKLESCIFCSNINSKGVIAGSSSMNIEGCTFFQNNLDSTAAKASFYGCFTSLQSFGAALFVDANCEQNIAQMPDVSVPRIDRCKIGEEKACSVGYPSAAAQVLIVLLLNKDN